MDPEKRMEWALIDAGKRKTLRIFRWGGLNIEPTYKVRKSLFY